MLAPSRGVSSMPARAPIFHGSPEMKKTSFFTCVAALSVATLSLGCDDAGSSGGGGSGGSTTTTTPTDPFASGTLLDVPVPESARAWVDLDTPAVVDETAAWELAFEGRDVFTNGGES